MSKKLEEIAGRIDTLALEIVMIDSGDIKGLGKILNSMDTLEDLSAKIKEEALISLIKAMKEYLEKITLGQESDLSPFEKGISQLQEICRELNEGKGFTKDISSTLKALGKEESGSKGKESGGKEEESPESPVFKEEDKDIITDFVAESVDNLEGIEVKLMDLENDPHDSDTINDIFRPFHTIKGVSGFLNLNSINKLSHSVENLLDKARNGEITIDREIIDLIFDAVDMLKKMVRDVQTSFNEGKSLEKINIEPALARIDDIISQSETKSSVGEILTEKGVVSKEDMKEVLEVQSKTPDKRVGEILVEQKKVETREVASALREQKRFAEPAALHVKVDTQKLDNMVDMVGELAIAQSMLRQNEKVADIRDRKLDHLINQLNQITSGLQKTAMSLRMIPIKNTFQKMMRLVRDLARKGGKEVQLVMSGEDTEIDKNMVEELYDPMVHMIRNSIDHGLETPEQREAVNKPRQGTIHLSAYHKGGNIVIEIRDDGQGLNREKILKKAKAMGILEGEDALTDAEIDNLIFRPGFSTADKISDVSGRGVGMDVVRNTIEKLRGKTEIHSDPGKGTTFTMRLPLTLAIIDGMIVKVNDERFIIPTLAVQESFRPKESEYHTIRGKGEMIMVRDRLVQLIRLDNLLWEEVEQSPLNKDEKRPWERLVVVVESQERRRCILVDELLGREEIVIKSIGDALKFVKGIAGGAILGDGKVGLILDVAGIFDIASEE